MCAAKKPEKYDRALEKKQGNKRRKVENSEALRAVNYSFRLSGDG